MKINLFDDWAGKFSKPIQEHWESLGHTVSFNPTWEDAIGADLTFFYQGAYTAIEGVKKPGLGKIYVGVVDIEAWSNQPQTIDWNMVSGVTFIAEHIRDMVMPSLPMNREPDPLKVALIKPGINLDRFPLKKNFEKGQVNRIAYVTGDKRIWDVKRLDIALMMLRDLLDNTHQIWQLHILGSYSSHAQYNDYCEHLLNNLNLEGFVSWYERQESVSDWLEDKDYFLLPSTKEAFSYATAEAMAKGIKPVIGNWRSADINWKPFYCQTYRQMYNKLTEDVYEPKVYRKFIEDNYDENRYFSELDQFLEIK